jgi:hypothetical protein
MHRLVQLATRKWLETHGVAREMEAAVRQKALCRVPYGRVRELGSMPSTFPAREISSSAKARGTRPIEGLGFNTI